MNTVDADLNVITNTITSEGNNINYGTIYNSGNLYTPDLNMLYNSASGTGFDWNSSNSGKYIISTSAETGTITPGNCDTACTKCYASNDINQCYECATGYTLYNGGCKTETATFLQVPPKSNNFISLKLTNSNGSVDISQTAAVTISFWIKYWGQVETSTSECPVIVRINQSSDSFICIDVNTNNLFFYYQTSNKIFADENFHLTIGRWSFIAISNYYGGSNGTASYFPNMMNIYIMNGNTPRLSSFFIPSPGIPIQNMDLGYEILALFGDMRFYNNYINQPYGHVTSTSTIQNTDLFLRRLLMGSTTTDCLANSDVVSGDVSTIGYSCIADYNPFLDSANQCNSKTEFLDPSPIIKETGEIPSCTKCDSVCTIVGNLCANSGFLGYTCDYNDGINWFRKDPTTSEIYCSQPPYVDLAKYSKVEVDDLSVSLTDEYSTDLWIYIYSYNEINIGFDSYEVIWDYHMKLLFYNESNQLKLKCFPVYNLQSTESLSNYAIDPTLTFYKWNYVQCSANLNTLKYYVTTYTEQIIRGTPTSVSTLSDTSSLTLQYSSGAKANYGFLFIREIKLWNIYDIREFFTKCVPTYLSQSSTVIHYFPLNTTKEEIVDEIQGKTGVWTKNTEFFGYNVVDYYNTMDIDGIPFTLPNCAYITVSPRKGYFHVTNFYIKCEPPVVGKEDNYTYKFSYAISGSSSSGNPVKYPIIADYVNSTYVTFAFSDLSLYSNTDLIDVFCETKSKSDGNVTTTADRIELDPNGLSYEQNFKNLINGLNDFSSPLSEQDLLSRAITLGSLAQNYYQYVEKINRTTDMPTLDDSVILVQDPVCTDSFCNDRGECTLMDRMLTCVCNQGYYGSNCQLGQTNAIFLKSIYTTMWNELTYNNTFNFTGNQISTSRVTAIDWLVSGASKFLGDDSFFDNFFQLTNYVMKNLSDQVGNNIGLWMEMFDRVYINYQEVTNKYRIQNSNNTIDRATLLTSTQKASLSTYFSDIKNCIIEFSKLYIKQFNSTFQEKNDFEVQHLSFHIYIKNITKSFNFTDFFEDRIKNYQGYLDASNSSDEIFGNNSNMWMVYIFYEVNPFMYDDDIYQKVSSFMNTIYFADPSGTYKTITNLTNPVEIYLPFDMYNLTIVNYINAKQSMFNPDGEISPDNPIVTSPIYVLPNGTVLDMPQDERIALYHRNYSLYCKYFDETQQLFVAEGVEFYNLTENYIKCRSSHFSDFGSFYDENVVHYGLDGPFFYLNFPQVLTSWSNFISNKCFFMILVLSITFFFSLFIFILIDVPKFKQENLLDFIKLQILKEQRKYKDEIEVYAEFLDLNQLNAEVDNNSIPEIEESPVQLIKIKSTKSQRSKTVDNFQSIEMIKPQNQYQNTDDNHEFDDLEEDSSQMSNQKLKKKNRRALNHYSPENNFGSSPKSKDMNKTNINNTRLSKYRLKIENAVNISNHELKGVKYNNFAIAEEYSSERKSTLHHLNQDPADVSEFDDGTVLFKKEEFTPTTYFLKNLLLRHIYIASFYRRNSFNPRYKKIILLFNLLSLMLFWNTLFYTSLNYFNLVNIEPNLTTTQIIFFSFVVAMVSNTLLLAIIPLFRVTNRRRHVLYKKFRQNKQLELIKEWNKMTNFNTKIALIGLLIIIIIMGGSYYFTLLYCAVISPMQMYIILGWISAFLVDFLILEVIIEAVCWFLYYCYKKKQCLGSLYKFLNAYRDFRSLF